MAACTARRPHKQFGGLCAPTASRSAARLRPPFRAPHVGWGRSAAFLTCRLTHLDAGQLKCAIHTPPVELVQSPPISPSISHMRLGSLHEVTRKSLDCTPVLPSFRIGSPTCQKRRGSSPSDTGSANGGLRRAAPQAIRSTASRSAARLRPPFALPMSDGDDPRRYNMLTNPFGR